MATVTYLTRALPFFIEIRESRYLKYVPASVFSALVFPDILFDPDKLVVGLILFAVTFKNRNLLVAFVVGVSLLYMINLAQRIYP